MENGTTSGAITVSINGEPRLVPEAMALDALLQDLGLQPQKVAVERNLAVVPKSLYPKTELQAGDRLEIVHFVGGG
ncbi:MAG: sulfur carrier protein ThiS [Pseudomonadota bacterium]